MYLQKAVGFKGIHIRNFENYSYFFKYVHLEDKNHECQIWKCSWLLHLSIRPLGTKFSKKHQTVRLRLKKLSVLFLL